MIIKSFVITLYQVMYNRQLNISGSRNGDGKASGANFLALAGCAATTLFFSILFLNVTVVCEIFRHQRMHFTSSKGVAAIYFAISICIMYLILFKLFAVEPADEGGYKIQEQKTRTIWIIYILNIALVLILPVVRKVIFKI